MPLYPGASSAGGVTDHGALTGLADNDHSSYALTNGSNLTLPDASVAARKVALGAASATVATSETTTSTSFADLSTVGPTATPASGVTQDNLVMMQARIGNSTAGGYVIMNVAVAAQDPGDDALGMIHKAPTQATAGDHKFNSLVLFAAKASGTAYKARYKVSANTGTFIDRSVIAIPI